MKAAYAIGGPGITGRMEPTADTAMISHATESQTQITRTVYRAGRFRGSARGRKRTMAAAMFDRFTDRARKVMGYSRQESQRYNHEYIGTEHMLLGLVAEGTGTACDVLKTLDIDRKRIREETEKLLTHGTTMATMGQIPFTPRARKALELAYQEASNLGHNYIGTEHLLLGLIREREGIGAAVLRTLKVELEDVREEVLELLGSPPASVSGKWELQFIGLEDDAFPQRIAARVQARMEELRSRPCPPHARHFIVAFAPERDPRVMYALGNARSQGVRVVLLHLPGERFEVGDAICLEVNDDLPERLEALLLIRD
jgi:hypothetical protein